MSTPSTLLVHSPLLQNVSPAPALPFCSAVHFAGLCSTTVNLVAVHLRHLHLHSEASSLRRHHLRSPAAWSTLLWFRSHVPNYTLPLGVSHATLSTAHFPGLPLGHWSALCSGRSRQLFATTQPMLATHTGPGPRSTSPPDGLHDVQRATLAA